MKWKANSRGGGGRISLSMSGVDLRSHYLHLATLLARDSCVAHSIKRDWFQTKPHQQSLQLQSARIKTALHVRSTTVQATYRNSSVPKHTPTAMYANKHAHKFAANLVPRSTSRCPACLQVLAFPAASAIRVPTCPHTWGLPQENNILRLMFQPSKAQWSLYVPHSGHYMYRTVVTICTVQWSLYVPPV